MTSLVYNNKLIEIIKDIRKNKVIYWFSINKNVVSFVSSEDQAKRLACNLIDVLNGDEHFNSTKSVYNKDRKKASWY